MKKQKILACIVSTLLGISSISTNAQMTDKQKKVALGIGVTVGVGGIIAYISAIGYSLYQKSGVVYNIDVVFDLESLGDESKRPESLRKEISKLKKNNERFVEITKIGEDSYRTVAYRNQHKSYKEVIETIYNEADLLKEFPGFSKYKTGKFSVKFKEFNPENMGNFKNKDSVVSFGIINWKDVADCYEEMAEKSKVNSAQYFENMGDYYRCLSYDNPFFFAKAGENFFESSKKYREEAEKINSASDVNYQLAMAKSCEMNAKYREMYCERKDIHTTKGGRRIHDCMGLSTIDGKPCSCTSYSYVVEAWQEVEGKKDSYNTYAKFNELKNTAKYHEEKKDPVKRNEFFLKAVEACDACINDKILEKSFGNSDYSDAFKAYLMAKKNEILFFLGKASKEEVADAYEQASKKDSGLAYLQAFEKEALMRKKLAEMGTIIL